MRQSISLLTHFCAKGNAAPENGVTCKGFQELTSRKGSENGISGDSCGNEKMRREYNKAFWHVFHGIDGTGGSGPVSYTHLDVYKRQVQSRICGSVPRILSPKNTIIPSRIFSRKYMNRNIKKNLMNWGWNISIALLTI